MKKEKHKSLAISILNWNNIDDTKNCLKSLQLGSYKNFDIFLLDNGSKNINEYKELKKVYEKEKNIIVSSSEKNLGFSGGNNYNLELITSCGTEYDYILLLSNDTSTPKEFLSTFMKTVIKSGDIGIFGPQIKNFDESIQSCGARVNLFTGGSQRFMTYSDSNKENYVSGACFLLSSVLLQKLGGLDETFFAYYEETDYCLRAKSKGYTIQALDDCFIYHKEETANNKKKPYYTYLMFRNRLLFLKKHAHLIQRIVSHMFLIGYLIILFPIHFGIHNYKYAFAGIIDGLQGKGGAPRF